MNFKEYCDQVLNENYNIGQKVWIKDKESNYTIFGEIEKVLSNEDLAIRVKRVTGKYHKDDIGNLLQVSKKSIKQ